MTITKIMLVAAATATALVAGLFYSWTCSVIPGLARVQNREYIAAMQSINRAIQNPVFFASFMGAAVLLPIATYMHYGQPYTTRFWLLLAATILYLAGVMGVTIFGNIPLNDALDAFHLQTASPQEIAAQRAAFEAPWNSLNTVRTVSSFFSIVLVIIACLSRSDT